MILFFSPKNKNYDAFFILFLNYKYSNFFFIKIYDLKKSTKNCKIHIEYAHLNYLNKKIF